MTQQTTRFYDTYYDSPAGAIAILTMDNGLDYRKPNTFGQAALNSLSAALDRIQSKPEVCGLMLTGKPYIFAAGADLAEIPGITTFDQGYRIGKLGHSVMQRLGHLQFPTLAAINGVALGGGLEIALHCHYRTVSNSASGIGFPEVFLGLIPGWGGCTLTTGLLGAEKALQIIVKNPLMQNRTISGKEAFELGLADRLFDGVEFMDASLRLLVDIVSGKEEIARQATRLEANPELFQDTRNFVDSKVHGAAPAPYRAITLISSACNGDIEAGFEAENRALGDLIKTRQCKASIYSFDLVNRYARKPAGAPAVQGVPVKKVGILGSGLMASQLAQLFVHRLAVPVIMKDVRQDLVDRGVLRVRQELSRLVEKRKLKEGKARYLSTLVKGTMDYGDFSDCNFVVEAVFEEIAVKKGVFQELEPFVGKETIFATNTSALSVTEMSTALNSPERLVGLHFFNPVAVLPLVEVIKAGQTGDVALATAFEIAKQLRKTAILVKDSPGFLVNRILIKMLADCLFMVDAGAGFKEVDEALLSLGLPMAPFELLGMVGLPVAMHVLETLNHSFGEKRFPLSQNLKRIIDAKKAAIYLPGSREVDPDIERLWVRRCADQFRPGDIQESVLGNLAREVDLILKEGVVGDPRDVDLAMLLGAGWPFFMGGLTLYLDMAGISPRVLQKVFFNF